MILWKPSQTIEKNEAHIRAIYIYIYRMKTWHGGKNIKLFIITFFFRKKAWNMIKMTVSDGKSLQT